MGTHRYHPSDLTDAQWELIEPLAFDIFRISALISGLTAGRPGLPSRLNLTQIIAKPLLLPGDHGAWLYEDQHFMPTGPKSGEPGP